MVRRWCTNSEVQHRQPRNYVWLGCTNHDEQIELEGYHRCFLAFCDGQINQQGGGGSHQAGLKGDIPPGKDRWHSSHLLVYHVPFTNRHLLRVVPSTVTAEYLLQVIILDVHLSKLRAGCTTKPLQGFDRSVSWYMDICTSADVIEVLTKWQVFFTPNKNEESPWRSKWTYLWNGIETAWF